MENLVKTNDGSNTLYSSTYNQNFHDENTGALSEALSKHVIPAFTYHHKQHHYKILDICYGLGYNTLATLYYVLTEGLNVSLEIISPELDLELVQSLEHFEYPKEFEILQPIIQALSQTQHYNSDQFNITIGIGNAREFIQKLDEVDIVYQDAFSSEVNQELWTKEYFDDIYQLCKDDTIITTYSIATPVRLSMYEAGFEIYEITPVKKKQTIAFKTKQNVDAKYIDMELKKQNNKEAKAIYDEKRISN